MNAPPTALPRVTLARPDDWHLHLRDGAAMAAVVGATARVFGRALIMPNLAPPVTTTADARAYRARIVGALPAGAAFVPLMTLYLTDRTDAGEIAAAKASGIVHAVKYYPAGATTNSASGVTALARAYPALAAMEEHGVVLSVHGEVTDPDIDVFDRERVFVERSLSAIVRDFPGSRSCWSTSRPARPRTSCARRRRPSPPRSRRSISSTRAMRCSSAACGRTSIACPS